MDSVTRFVRDNISDVGWSLTIVLAVFVVDSAVWEGILRAFDAEPTVELAYPTIRTYRTDREAGG